MVQLLPKQVMKFRIAIRVYKLAVKIKMKRRSAHLIIAHQMKAEIKKKIKDRLFFVKNCALQ